MALTKITTSLVAVNTLTAANIADNTIDATKIAQNQILARHIAAGALSDQLTGITNSSGDFTIDIAGDISLDADGGDINLKDGGTTFGTLSNSSSDFWIGAGVQDKDIIFRGNDNGSYFSALTLDMSDAGTASFSHDIKLVDNGIARFGAGEDLLVFHDGSNNYIISNTQDQDLLIQGNDGGSTITALSFDMSLAGAATFNDKVTAGSIITAGTASSAGIGVALADANVSELGRGYLSLGRDDTADAAQVSFSKNGVLHTSLITTNNEFIIRGAVSNQNINFEGNDGGSAITALTLDMSDAGTATFNHDIKLGDGGIAKFGAGGDLQILHDGSDSFINDTGTGNLLIRAADQFLVQDTGGKTHIKSVIDAQTELYHNNSKKLATESGGVNVTGSVVLSGTLELASAAMIDWANGDARIREGVTNNYDLQFQTYDGSACSTKLTIQGGGNIGIGTTSPTRTLDLNHASTAPDLRLGCDGNDRSLIILDADRSSAGNALGTIVWRWNNTDAAVIEAYAGADTTNKDDGGLSFQTVESGASLAERMRIHSGGEVSIGNNVTIGSGATTYLAVGTGSGSATLSIYTGTDGYGYLNFADGTSGAAADPGYIRYNHNDNTLYTNRVFSGDFNDTSDISLKENITDLSKGWDIIKELKPRSFDWKDTDTPNRTGRAGFIAQEVETVLPKEVYGSADEDGVSKKAVNVTGIVAHLVKTVQELEARIKTLEDA